jgi:hypothetical protein
MANATITVLEADGVTETDVVVLDVGRQAAAASKSVALATDDSSNLASIKTAVEILDNAISGTEMQVDVLTMPTVTVNAHAVTVASGGVASGAIASGAVASGAFASGAVASGAFASGSIAAGAITAGATSHVKLDDAAFASGNALTGVGAVRDDALSTLTPAEGDWTPLRVSSTGALHVTGASGATEFATNAAHVDGQNGVMTLAVRDDALTTLTPADGDYVPIRTTSTGALWVQDASLNANGQATMANSSSVTVASDQTPIAVVGKSNVYSVTLSTDTAAYASGDLLADTQQMDGFFRIADGTGVIQTVSVTDEEAQNVKMYLIFMKTTTSLGSENSTPNISDANLSAGYLGHVTIETTDWLTVSGCSVACIKNIGLPVEAVSGTDDLYIAALNATGTPDWDADSLKVQIGVLLD